MTEKSTALNDLEEISLKIEAELPDELNQLVSFRCDEQTGNLIVDWAVELPAGDLKLLTDVVAAYGGSFVNIKDASGAERTCFSIPKNQPPPAIPEKKTEGQPADLQLKQQSPLAIHQSKYCSSCTDHATCNPRTPGGRERLNLCFKVMELQYLDFIAERLHKITLSQEANDKLLTQILSRPVQTQFGVAASPQQTSPVSKSVTVPRDTRPLHGHVDMGIVWTYEVGSRGNYEKAVEKDNNTSDEYFQLHEWVADAEKPFKDGYFYWVFTQGPSAIGRKKTHRGGK